MSNASGNVDSVVVANLDALHEQSLPFTVIFQVGKSYPGATSFAVLTLSGFQ